MFESPAAVSSRGGAGIFHIFTFCLQPPVFCIRLSHSAVFTRKQVRLRADGGAGGGLEPVHQGEFGQLHQGEYLVNYTRENILSTVARVSV